MIKRLLFYLFIITSCSQEESVFKTPLADSDNGGLLLPDGFGALVVADSVGPARHLAVNKNGDIYIKLRIDEGDKGNMALRDIDGDGKIDIYKRRFVRRFFRRRCSLKNKFRRRIFWIF